METKKAGKGLQDYLSEDKGLAKKISYEEFEAKKATPDNSDEGIENAYNIYKKEKARIIGAEA